ncbi:hypothetical protein [Bacillus sp. es.034]|uniref:hypothetical protein n=1 Tax=Bacillus sp. es.034 TaxID=1761763 RepID=UPI00115C4EC7|nr:hypothetical protein [Bacillus sp. es.034]
MGGGILPSNRYFFIQVIAIAAVTVPSLGIYLGEEMKLFMGNEFIQVSRSIGAGRFHLFKQHLLPKFRRHSIVLFSEQVSQTIALLISSASFICASEDLKSPTSASWKPFRFISQKRTNGQRRSPSTFSRSSCVPCL